MNFLLIAFCIFTFTFIFAFVVSIIKKKFYFISFALSYIGTMLSLMYKFDLSYLMDIVGDITNFKLYLFIASIVVLIIAVLEMFIIRKSKSNKNKTNEAGKVYLERDTKIYYFNLLNEDIAYYNDKKNKFVLNNSFRRKLNIEDIEVDKDYLFNLVAFEDKNVFKELKDNSQFKLRTIDGEEWYQYKKSIVGAEEYSLIIKIDNKLGKDANVGTYKELDRVLKEKEASGKEFALVLSNISSIVERIEKSFTNLNTSKDVKDKDLREVIIVKYLSSVLNGDLKDLVKIYKVGASEYAFVIEDKDAYFIAERALLNNTSIFLGSDIIINDKTYHLKARAAAVYSKYVKIREDYHVINAAFDSLQLLIGSATKQDYIIYQQENENENNIDLKKLGIDLDNDIKEFYKN